MKLKRRLEVGSLIPSLEESLEILVVPFSIPPMLARWDRAIWELRRRWDEEERGPFPIPRTENRRPYSQKNRSESSGIESGEPEEPSPAAEPEAGEVDPKRPPDSDSPSELPVRLLPALWESPRRPIIAPAHPQLSV